MAPTLTRAMPNLMGNNHAPPFHCCPFFRTSRVLPHRPLVCRPYVPNFPYCMRNHLLISPLWLFHSIHEADSESPPFRCTQSYSFVESQSKSHRCVPSVSWSFCMRKTLTGSDRQRCNTPTHGDRRCCTPLRLSTRFITSRGRDLSQPSIFSTLLIPPPNPAHRTWRAVVVRGYCATQGGSRNIETGTHSSNCHHHARPSARPLSRVPSPP